MNKIEKTSQKQSGSKKGKGRKNKGKGSKTKMLPTLIRLGGYAKRHWLKIAGAMISVLIATGLGLVPPWLIRYGIDNLILEGRPKYLFILGAVMIGTALVKGLFDFIKSYISEYIAQNIIHDIRIKLFRHLYNLSFSFYDEARTGDLMSRLTADADSLR